MTDMETRVSTDGDARRARPPLVPSVRKVAKAIGVVDQKGAANMFKPGDMVDGRYKVVRCLGVGAMGSVFLVNHTRLNKPFALKMIIPELALRKDFVARFEREAAACSRLTHPNCISVTDFGHNDAGNLFLVMEYVDGVPLSDVVKAGPVPLMDAIEITLQVLSGLDHAHSKGIIHRDMKLENIMRCTLDNGDALIKILDFGMAKAQMRADENPAITRKGMVMGTPQYLAPEQLRSQPVDERSDLYSVGVMFFRLLSAKPVFAGETMVDVLTLKLNQPAPSLRTATSKAFPETLEAFFSKVLQRDPNLRYSSARDMMDALFQIRDQLKTGSSAPPASSYADELIPQMKTGQVAAVMAEKIALSSAPPKPTNRPITLSDLFHRPIDDLVYWYTCGRNPKKASWGKRLSALFTDRIGKLVLFRFIFITMFLVIGALSAVVAIHRDSIEAFRPQWLTFESLSDTRAGQATATGVSPAAGESAGSQTMTIEEAAVLKAAADDAGADMQMADADSADDDVDTENTESVDTAPDTVSQNDGALVDSAASAPPVETGGEGIVPVGAAASLPPDDMLSQIRTDIEKERCTKAATQLATYLDTPHADIAGGNYLLGRARMCVGRHKDALVYYRKAVEANSAYRNDAVMTEDVRQIVLAGKATDEGLEFMGEVMGKAALPMLVNFAAHAQRKSFRQKSRKLVAEMGALDQVNLEASYDWDLNQTANCRERKEIVAKLAALESKRAKMVLIRARDMKERDGIFREKYTHACVRDDIIAAIDSMAVTH